jgi:hypothetical protein
MGRTLRRWAEIFEDGAFCARQNYRPSSKGGLILDRAIVMRRQGGTISRLDITREDREIVAAAATGVTGRIDRALRSPRLFVSASMIESQQWNSSRLWVISTARRTRRAATGRGIVLQIQHE